MIAATFHGPNYYSPNNDEDSIEVFKNIGHAIGALFERYEANGHYGLPVKYLSGKHGNVRFPAVTEGHYLRCYKVTDIDDDADADIRYHDSDVEGQKLEALSRVHLGVADYILTLMPPFGQETTGSVAVSVTRRGYGQNEGTFDDLDSSDIPVVHLVPYPLPSGPWSTACGEQPADPEDITAAKDHVTCPGCRDTEWYRNLPVQTRH